MEELYAKLQERKKRETLPLIPIFEAYNALLQLTDDLQRRIQESDQEINELRRTTSGNLADGSILSSTASNNGKALTLALRNETRLRDKLERLQEDFNTKVKLAEDSNASKEASIRELSEKIQSLTTSSTKLAKQLQESEFDQSLAEQQNEELKRKIRDIQRENEHLKKENGLFGDRLITDKEKMVNELNQLNEVVVKLSKENAELRALQKKSEEDRKATPATPAWFGVFSTSFSAADNNNRNAAASPAPKPRETAAQSHSLPRQQRQLVVPVSCPTIVHETIAGAHSTEGTCLRFDRHDYATFVTSSIGGSVKTWNATTGAVCSIFYGTPGHSMLTCDVSRSLVAGAGNDKTCRVWDTVKNRMIHRLAGHQHKVTSVRIFNDNQSVLTCSADRSMKIWDIAKQTYRLCSTLSFNSFAGSMDIVADSKSAVSGHSDGSLLFWDVETAQKTTEIRGLHEGGITSVCIDPSDPTRILTNSLASSSLQIIDVRSGSAVRTLRDDSFSTRNSDVGCIISPDGQFVAAGSDSGDVFVWDLGKGVLQRKLADVSGCPLVGLDWRLRAQKDEPQIGGLNSKGAVVLLR